MEKGWRTFMPPRGMVKTWDRSETRGGERDEEADLAAVVGVPAGDDHAGEEGVLVLVAELLHERGGSLDEGRLAELERVHVLRDEIETRARRGEGGRGVRTRK